MTKKEDLILDFLTHFHPEQNAGWSIHADIGYLKNKKPAQIEKFLKAEFGKTLYLNKQGLISSAKKPKFKPEHEAILYKFLMESYKDEADRLYNGLKRLVD